MIRRYGDVPKRGKRHRLRPGAYAVLWNGTDVLTTFQEEPLPELQLPGGGIDPGEHPIHALHREVMEETGWVISTPRHLGAVRRFTFMPDYDLWAEKLCHIYLARPVLRRGPPTEAGHTPVWMSPADAMSHLANVEDRDFVRRVVSA